MCLWNMDAPSGNKVKIWQKSLSPTFWPRPTPRGMWCRQTNGQTDDPITRCPGWTFQAGGIKIINPEVIGEKWEIWTRGRPVIWTLLLVAKAQSRSNMSSLRFNLPDHHHDPLEDSLYFLSIDTVQCPWRLWRTHFKDLGVLCSTSSFRI